VKGIRYCTYL